jgi:pyruvate formate lyase activating enzyme
MRPRSLLADGVCLACSRRCDLAKGPGVCGVRRLGSDGELVVDDTITHAAVQRVETKPLYHFRPGARLLTLGSWGCGTRCRYCRNGDVALARRRPPRIDVGRAAADPVGAALELGVAGIAYSYNEPLVRAERVAATFAAARDAGLETAVVTSGWATDEVIDLLVPVTSAWRVDLKATTERSSELIFGPDAPWAAALPALHALGARAKHVEISVTYCPEIHDRDELDGIAAVALGACGTRVAVHLQPLLPAHALTTIAMPELESLLEAREALRQAGLEHVYVHLLGAPELRTTWCRCGEPLVERDIASVRTSLVGSGRCAACGETAPIDLGNETERRAA